MKSDLKLYKPIEFILEPIIVKSRNYTAEWNNNGLPWMQFEKNGIGKQTRWVGRKVCSKYVVTESNCCGFAGDRGISFPELNKHGLRTLKSSFPKTSGKVIQLVEPAKLDSAFIPEFHRNQ